MNKLVYGVFKAIAISMIMVFVLDMAMYMYKAISLDQRMKNIMVSMQRTVAENNYLPETSYNTYVAMLRSLANSLQGADDNPFVGTATGSGNALHLNYGNNAWGVDSSVKDAIESSGSSSGISLVTDMSKVADYGDIMVVQSAVMVRQPTWRFIGTGRGSDEFQNDRTSSAITANTTTFTYTYYVPCMNYSKKLNDN